MNSNLLVHDVWIGIGPFKLHLSWPLVLLAGAGMALISVVAVYFLMRSRGRA